MSFCITLKSFIKRIDIDFRAPDLVTSVKNSKKQLAKTNPIYPTMWKTDTAGLKKRLFKPGVIEKILS